MNRKKIVLILAVAMSVLLAGCGKADEETVTMQDEVVEENSIVEPVAEIVEEVEEAEEEVVAEEELTREGFYRSELTNEWIDEALEQQRPIAAMVDNEKTALPHYGLSTADIVYEITNSTKNQGITRFMVLVKDWESIEQLGSIRSVRPTNLQIAPEYNAVVCHDGGPFYIDTFLANDYVENFSGTFSRVNNGKAREFTEYIVTGDLDKNFNNRKYSRTYNEYYEGPHFVFASEQNPIDLARNADAISCTNIDLPYKHNNPFLEYDEKDGLYYYSEYGTAHVDPGNNNAQLSFKNVILQNTTYHEYDENGYLGFNVIDSGRTGYYITNGQAIPVTWSKETDLTPTRYYDANGDEITLNTGKTYIAIIPNDIWDNLEIE